MTSTPIITAPPGSAAAGSGTGPFGGRWRMASPTARTRAQVAVFGVVVLAAYHYSLSSLLQNLDLDTPLAYVGLVPFISLALAALRSRPMAVEPAIHDRQVDFIVGIPLLATALAINLLLPRPMSTMFWMWRIDLLSLPFFVAGAAAIIFGVRALWRQRLAVGYLFFAWPVPYTALLLHQMDAVTGLTLRGLGVLVRFTHIGSLAPYTDGSVFDIVHHGHSFPLSVVSACSGVNGMVGFLLVGAAFGAAVVGPRLRKAVWLVGGLALLWFLNLGRLLLIFWVGQEFGEHLAIKVLHPYVGLVTFNIGVLGMLLLLKSFGLRMRQADEGRRCSTVRRDGIVTSSSPRLPAVPHLFPAVVVLALLGLVLGVNNTQLRRYDLVARADGEPKLASFLAYPASPPGWRPTLEARFDFAKPFFGESSLWYRYSYSPTLATSDLHSPVPVIADVVNSDNLSSFSAYGVEACYRFHGYSLRSLRQVDLGGGITGQALVYASPTEHQDWSVIYWIWPVRNGDTVRYERVILYALDVGGFGTVKTAGAEPSASTPPSATSLDRLRAQSSSEQRFLVAFARETVRAQVHVAVGTQLLRSSTASAAGPTPPGEGGGQPESNEGGPSFLPQGRA